MIRELTGTGTPAEVVVLCPTSSASRFGPNADTTLPARKATPSPLSVTPSPSTLTVNSEPGVTSARCPTSGTQAPTAALFVQRG